MPTVKHPLLRLAIQDAESEIRLYSEHYPRDFPSRRVPAEARELLFNFLKGLVAMGVVPPGWSKPEPGLFELHFKSVKCYDYNQRAKEEPQQ